MSTAETTPDANDAAGATPTVFDGDGGNTRIHYLMTSGGRKVKEGDIVLEGRLSPEDIETVRKGLSDGQGFSPDAVGVPDLGELMPLSWTPRGDERHDIAKIGCTNSRPTAGAVDADQFTAGFEVYDYKATMNM